jgi:hypothetical protein
LFLCVLGRFLFLHGTLTLSLGGLRVCVRVCILVVLL